MALFLAINTSSVTLLPTGVIAIRAAAGSSDPSAILPTTLLATLCSTAAAILAAKLYSRWSSPAPPVMLETAQAGAASQSEAPGPVEDDEGHKGYPLWISMGAIACLAAMVPLAVIYGRTLSAWIIPGLMVFFLCFGALRRVRVYEVLVEGAREGFQVAVRIIPYLVAILVAVGMLRASGAMDAFIGWIGPFTTKVGLPAEALPMALMRPLSGSGAYGIMVAIINDPALGPDSYIGYLVSTLQGSTETTFYVLAVYFGAVRIRRTRHALAAALTADAVGIVAAVAACRFLFG
jgi:spore maturation protein SpmB